MTTYVSDITTNKTFKPNIVVKFLGQYFSKLTPDSGLIVNAEYSGLIGSLLLNPTKIDPRRVSTTIANFSVNLIDKNGVLTALMGATGSGVGGLPIEIYLGHCGVSMDFADYLKLPTTKIKKIAHIDNSYTFTCLADSDRMNRAIYQIQTTRVSGEFFATSTSLVCKDDISLFPSTGTLLVQNEYMSYTAKDDTTNTFSGLVRGVANTTPVAHSDDTSLTLADFVTDHPINILLKLLVSKGGGSAYDVLQDGIGLDQTLVDIADLEDKRDNVIPGITFAIGISNVSNALQFIEDQILFPNNLRFAYSTDSKLTVAVLDRVTFVADENIIDHDTMTKFPQWNVDLTKIVNNIQISWDFDDDTGAYNHVDTFVDQASADAYGLTNILTFQWDGVKAAHGGQAFVTNFVQRYFGRLSTPNPEIQLSVQMDKSLVTIGDRARLTSSYIPADNGTLKFDDELEVISQGVNWVTGDVSLTLLFTSFTGTRPGYIAPSDLFTSITSQKKVGIATGRGAQYKTGWAMRLWNENTQVFESDDVNYISDVTGDVITFTNNFVTTLTTHHRMRFATYDKSTAAQKRYCFAIHQGDTQFADQGKPYKIAI